MLFPATPLHLVISVVARHSSDIQKMIYGRSLSFPVSIVSTADGSTLIRSPMLWIVAVPDASVGS